MDELFSLIRALLGTEGDLQWWQMGIRALVVYLIAVILVRLGDKRFIGKFTAFDVILGFMLGSILSRAITGNAPFIPALVAAAVLVGLHYLMAVLSYHSSWFGDVVKGRTRTLIEEGEIQWDAMRRAQISRKDLLSALRENGRVEDPARVKLARLERSGNISVIPREE